MILTNTDMKSYYLIKVTINLFFDTLSQKMYTN